MSFDITIAADESFSESVSTADLRAFLTKLPGVEPNGDTGFVLCEGDRLWMEIDLETVADDGELEEDQTSSPTVNCLRLHIPYAFLGDSPQTDYFPTALAIARRFGWSAIDEQTGELLEG